MTQKFPSALFASLLALALSACAGLDRHHQGSAAIAQPVQTVVTDPQNIPRTPNGYAQGYLSAAELADSTRFLALPPVNGSVAKDSDEDIARRMTGDYYGSDRWLLAALDAELAEPVAVSHFDCRTGVVVTLEDTPHLYQVAQKP